MPDTCAAICGLLGAALYQPAVTHKSVLMAEAVASRRAGWTDVRVAR